MVPPTIQVDVVLSTPHIAYYLGLFGLVTLLLLWETGEPCGRGEKKVGGWGAASLEATTQLSPGAAS